MAALATGGHRDRAHGVAEIDRGDEAVAGVSVPALRARPRVGAERGERSPDAARERHREARLRVVEARLDAFVDPLEAVDLAPRRLPRAAHLPERVRGGGGGGGAACPRPHAWPRTSAPTRAPRRPRAAPHAWRARPSRSQAWSGSRSPPSADPSRGAPRSRLRGACGAGRNGAGGRTPRAAAAASARTRAARGRTRRR